MFENFYETLQETVLSKQQVLKEQNYEMQYQLDQMYDKHCKPKTLQKIHQKLGNQKVLV